MSRADAIDYLPAVNSDHMLSLTDDTGILQHAIFSVPNSAKAIRPMTTRVR